VKLAAFAEGAHQDDGARDRRRDAEDAGCRPRQAERVTHDRACERHHEELADRGRYRHAFDGE
jgi:hypothetical protein